MALRSWTWMHITLAIVAYWAVALGAWWWYTARPAQQARARAAAAAQTQPGPRPGQQVVMLSGTLNLSRPLAALIIPPLLLIVLRWIL